MKRVECPKCKQSRKYFCYDCFIPMGDPSLVPNIELPIELDMYEFISFPSFLERLAFGLSLGLDFTFLCFSVFRDEIDAHSLHWPAEIRSKSTAVHACVVAPTHTRFLDPPNIPDYDPEETVLLFPSEVCRFLSFLPGGSWFLSPACSFLASPF